MLLERNTALVRHSDLPSCRIGHQWLRISKERVEIRPCCHTEKKYIRRWTSSTSTRTFKFPCQQSLRSIYYYRLKDYTSVLAGGCWLSTWCLKLWNTATLTICAPNAVRSASKNREKSVLAHNRHPLMRAVNTDTETSKLSGLPLEERCSSCSAREEARRLVRT